jgi:FAD synthetase
MTTGDSPARDSHHTEPLVSDTPLPFPELCAKIHDRIYAFLEDKDVSPRLKSLQEQTRTALGVISEALDKYRYVERRGAVPYLC